jgi:esterase
MRTAIMCAVLAQLACASVQRGLNATQVHHASVNGTNIAYTLEGSGPLLVIIHGAWGDYRSWSSVAAALALHHTVVRVSMRLHSPNSWPASEVAAYAQYREATHAADVAAVIEKIGRGPADVLGHSYGGDVAAMLALSRPDLVRRLVLAEAMLSRLQAEIPGQEKFAQETREWQEQMLTSVRNTSDPFEVVRPIFEGDGPGIWDALPGLKTIVTANARTTGPFVASDFLDVPYSCQGVARLQMPVLILEAEKGDGDAHVMDTRFLECVPKASKIVIPKATHLMQYTEPDAVVRAVTEFVQ